MNPSNSSGQVTPLQTDLSPSLSLEEREFKGGDKLHPYA